jgi:hypothetical protein
VGDLGERFEVRNVVLGVADRLDVESLGLLVDQPLELRGIIPVDETDLEAKARKCHLELVIGAAVKKRRRDNVVARLEQRGERKQLCRLTGGGRYGGRSAFECCHPLFEDIGSRVHDPGVDVSELLQPK